MQEGAIINIKKGEKLHKLFIFKPQAGRKFKFEFRVFTKEKKNGNLEMVSYSYKEIGGVPQKSGVIRGEDVPKKSLDGIINGVKKSTRTADDEYEVIDLTHIKTIEKQIEYLKQKDLVETYAIH
ncbi:MAG: hypothetical protein AB1567_00160 [bacterium]